MSALESSTFGWKIRHNNRTYVQRGPVMFTIDGILEIIEKGGTEEGLKLLEELRDVLDSERDYEPGHSTTS